jgi:hypothetical protein
MYCFYCGASDHEYLDCPELGGKCWWDDSPQYKDAQAKAIAMAVQAGEMVNKLEFITSLEEN